MKKKTNTRTKDTYESEIIDPGDRASAYAKRISEESYNNSPALIVVPHQPGNFRGPVGHTWQPHILEHMMKTKRRSDGTVDWVMLEEDENDGAGGKPQFFTALGFESMYDCGWEIITMTRDDLARTGRLGAYMINELNVKQITEDNFESVKMLFDGYGAALKKSNLVNITGEIAIMKDSITAFCDESDPRDLVFTWGASCHGLAHRDLLIDPKNIKLRMVVIGLFEHGYRCNGGTFFTKVVRHKWGKNPRMLRSDPVASRFLQAICKPSISYASFIESLVGWNPDGSIGTPKAKIAGIAHITGGGIWRKFGELLPQGMAAVLEEMPKPLNVFLEAQEISFGTPFELSDHAGYGTLHGGCGMLIVCAPQEAATVLMEADKWGIRAGPVGVIVPYRKHKLSIKSQFLQKKGKMLYSKN